MSFIPYRDPHPGRCQNYRSIHHPDGHTENLRCLDYEGTVHVCSFPPQSHVAANPTFAGSTYTQTKPEPWVKPT